MPFQEQNSRAKQIKSRFIRSYEELRYRGVVKTKKEFAEELGMPQSNFSRMEKSDNYEPTLSQIASLIDKYNISAEWLINGLGNPIKNI